MALPWMSVTGLLAAALYCGVGISLTMAQDEADSDTDYCAVDDFVDNDYLVRADDAVLIEIQHTSSNSLQIELLPVQNAASPYGENQKFSYSKVELVETQCGSGFISYLEGLPNWTERQILPVQTRPARLFARPWDVVVTLAPSTDARGDFCTDVASTGRHPMNFTIQQLDGSKLNTLATVPVDIKPQQMQMAVADFDVDGLEDLFVVNESNIWIYSATDPADPSQGISEVASLALPATVPGGRNAPRIGDLDDDGNLDVAWISGGTVPSGNSSTNDVTPKVVFATICSGLNDANGCTTDQAFTIQHRSPEIDLVPFPANDSPPYSPSAASLVGNFDVNQSGDELVVVQAQPSNSTPARTCVLEVYSFDAGLANATKLGSENVCDELHLELNGKNGFIHSIYADNGSFNFYDEQEQVAVGLEECYGQPNSEKYDCFEGYNKSHLTTITFDSSTGFEIDVLTQQTWQSNHWLGGIRFGRYGDTSDITSDATAADFQLQLAVIAGPFFGIFQAQNATGENFTLDAGIFGWWELPYGQTEGSSGHASNSTGGSALFAGDLQGRSQRLGPPEVVRVSGHSQPTVILGVPPMHVDAVDLAGANNSPRDVEPVNFSAFPSGYFTRYEFDTQSETASSTQSTTSWTKSTKESGGASLSAAGFSAKNKETYQQSWSQTSSSKSYTSQKSEDTVTDQTLTADKLLFREMVFNIYNYPLIGQTDCPASNPDCTASEMQPAYVTFSGGNMATNEASFIPGSQVEWYQPIHQPANVLSYPPSQRLLEDTLPGGAQDNSPLRTTNAFTTSGGSSRKLSLTSTSGASQTTGTTTNHSFDSKTSVSAKAFGVGASASYDYSTSTALSTLNSSMSALQASTGITINAQGPFLDQSLELYDYSVSPYLYGNFSGAPQTVSPDGQVQTTGILRTLYAADATTAGPWWTTTQSDYANFPDLALNHPGQWCIGSATDCGFSGTPETNQCINAGAVTTCAFFQDADSEPDPWLNDFYNMKGMFILDSASNSVDSVIASGPASPQLSQAIEGDTVVLGARLYNFSFVDMASANVDKVKVQFYYQEIDTTNHSLDSAGATLIEETEIDPVAPVCGAASANCDPDSAPANYAYAATSFDTSGFANKSVVFWVVAWMEDSAGALVAEVPSHGLTEVPAMPSSAVDVTKIGSEPYSNNVGLYRYALAIVEAATNPCAPGTDPSFLDLNLEPAYPLVGDKVRVSATIGPGDLERHHVGVVFSERHRVRHPHSSSAGVKISHRSREQGWIGDLPGRAFDYELLSRVSAVEPTEVLVSFRPQECGAHEIRAQMGDEIINAWLHVSCKVRICHRENSTIEVSKGAVARHLQHGDAWGYCAQ